jgi:dGTPase
VADPNWLAYENLLAPWAARGTTSRGWEFDEKKDVRNDYRSPFQHDRDRIVHSAAFRRLENKTQVYTNLFQPGDQFRKRLTHTLEVAQISRSIARTLSLNEDLTEAIALSHDIGHAPFGHKGQDILHDLMKEYGGFEHNTQTLRFLCLIERRYPDFNGLNLTYEVREAIAKKGIAKKPGQVEPLKDRFRSHPSPTLEAQVVDMSDPITYTAHDLDDGITAGTITGEMLQGCEFWMEGVEAVKRESPAVDSKILQYQVVKHIIGEQVGDLVENTRKNIEELGPENIDDIRNHERALAEFSPAIKAKHEGLKKFLRENMYDRANIKRMEHKAREVLRKLFDAFLEEPSLLPESVQKHFDEAKKVNNETRIVCDYIAGMTDRFAVDVHNDLFTS